MRMLGFLLAFLPFTYSALGQDAPENSDALAGLHLLSPKGIYQHIVNHTMLFPNRMFNTSPVIAYWAPSGLVYMIDKKKIIRFRYLVTTDYRLCIELYGGHVFCGVVRVDDDDHYALVVSKPGPKQGEEAGRFHDIWSGDSNGLIDLWAVTMKQKETEAAHDEKTQYFVDVLKDALLVTGAVIVGGAMVYGMLHPQPQEEDTGGPHSCFGNDWQRYPECFAPHMISKQVDTYFAR